MPTYEFKCKSCDAISSFVAKRYEVPENPACSKCGSTEMTRVFSAFAYHASEGDRMANFDTSKGRGVDFYKDSRNVGLWAKKRARELGADSATIKQLDEVVDRARDRVLSGDTDSVTGLG